MTEHKLNLSSIKLVMVLLFGIMIISSVNAAIDTDATLITDGSYTIATFTTNGYFNVTGLELKNVTLLMIGGGGGGGPSGSRDSGGGGAGGLIYGKYQNISVGNYNIVIGSGGTYNNNGTDTNFNSMTAKGGGSGGTEFIIGKDGGSGGGGGNYASGKGLGSQASYGNALGFANNGGVGSDAAANRGAGGGGGAGGIGANGTSTNGGTGGIGKTYSINGTSVCYAGGGGGGSDGGTYGSATCGGGDGAASGIGNNAAANLGAGGGGGAPSSNGGSGSAGIIILKYLTSESAPKITLNSPGNNEEFTSNTINFNITAIDDKQIENVSLYVNGTIQTTNTSGYNGTYLFSENLIDGFYSWYIVAYDNDTQGTQSGTRYFTIDTTQPVINIIYPANTTYSDGFQTGNNRSISLNWTATDNHLSSCWYNNGTQNISITCNTNNTIYRPYDTYTFWFYANDTFGNENAKKITATWEFRLLQNSVHYQEVTSETFTEDYILSINLSAGTSLSSAILYYNGTAYASSILASGMTRNLSNSFIIPYVSEILNISFYWSLTTNYGVFNTSVYNQTINPLDIDDCTINTNLILNYTIYDEDTRGFLNSSYWNTTTNLFIKLSGDIDGEEYEYYSGTLTNNSILICTNESLAAGQNYRLDAEVQYTADDYVTEYYYIENALLNISKPSINQSLYLLDVLSSQEFLITYKDNNLIPVEGALIELSRQYLDLGGYLSVEVSKTDTDGRTISHFVLNDEIYTIYVKKDGELLATFENVRAFCDDLLTGDCKINLNELTSTTNPDSFETYLDVIGNQDYDRATKVFTFTFTTTDNINREINLTLYKYNITHNEVICSEQVSSSSGTLLCTIPASYYNDTAQVVILVDGEEYANYLMPIQFSEDQELNPTRYLLAFLLVITLPLIAFGSAPLMLILFIVGLIVAGTLALIDWGGFIGPFSAFLWFVIAAIVLAVRASKRRQQ